MTPPHVLTTHPLGGPYPLEELRRRYPQLGDVALGIREKCVNDPLYLGAEVLGSELFRTPSTAHRAVGDSLSRCENSLYVDHRGTLKTTLHNVVGTHYLWIRFPNARYLFLQSNKDIANQISRLVRSHFVMNRAYKAVFPEFSMESADDSNVTSWSHPARQEYTAEGSFNVGTPGATTTGTHYEVIGASDLMNTATVPPPCGLSTIENMKSIIAWYASTDGLLVHPRQRRALCPPAHKTYNSNRWHDADHVAQILTADPNQPDGTRCKGKNGAYHDGEPGRITDGGYFRKIIRGVKRAPDGVAWLPTWAEVIPTGDLAALRASPSMTAATWAANFCSDPMPEGGMAFERRWLHTYGKDRCKNADWGGRCSDHHPEPLRESLVIAVTVDSAILDPATSRVAKSDRSALVTSGVEGEFPKRLYVLDILAGKWKPGDLVEKVFGVCAVWRPNWVGIEDIGAGLAIESMFLSEMQRSDRRVPYRKIKMPGISRVASKDARIAPLHAHAQNFGIWIHEDGRHEALVEELLRFGVAEHEDLADALGMRGVDLYSWTPSNAKKAAPELTFVPGRKPLTGADIIKRAQDRVRARKAPPWKRLTRHTA